MDAVSTLNEHTDRKTITWAACDALATTGKRPSISQVRSWTNEIGVTKGSDGDVQRDINLWYSTLLEMRQKGVLELPEPVANMARDLWVSACAMADERLAKEKADLVALELELRNAVSAAEEKEQATAHELELALQDAINVKQIKASMEADQVKSNAKHEANYGEYRAAIAAKEERIVTLESELTRVSTEHARNEEILESTRKHRLIEIDQARVEMIEWKDKAKRFEMENATTVETYRQNNSSLSASLSNLKGRNEAMTEALAASQLREKELLQQIDAIKSELIRVQAAGRSGKFKAQRPATRSVPVKRSKLK